MRKAVDSLWTDVIRVFVRPFLAFETDTLTGQVSDHRTLIHEKIGVCSFDVIYFRFNMFAESKKI